MKLIRTLPDRKHRLARANEMRHRAVAIPSVAPQDAEKPDPYATPLQRGLDAALILVTVLVLAFVWLSAEREQNTARSESSATQVQLDATWAEPAGDPLIATNTRPLDRLQP